MRAAVLENLGAIPGVYIPSWYQPVYDEQGNFRRLERLHEKAPRAVEKRVVRDFDSLP